MPQSYKLPHGLDAGSLCMHNRNLYRITTPAGDELCKLAQVNIERAEFLQLVRPTEDQLTPLTQDDRMNYILVMMGILLKIKY